MSALTVTAGAVDAVTFLGLGHVFAALATGNVLLLGFGVAGSGTPIARRPCPWLPSWSGSSSPMPSSLGYLVVVGIAGS
jgi:hypothetical protein